MSLFLIFLSVLIFCDFGELDIFNEVDDSLLDDSSNKAPNCLFLQDCLCLANDLKLAVSYFLHISQVKIFFLIFA